MRRTVFQHYVMMTAVVVLAVAGGGIVGLLIRSAWDAMP